MDPCLRGEHHFLVQEPLRQRGPLAATLGRGAGERHATGMQTRAVVQPGAHHPEVRLLSPQRQVPGKSRGEHGGGERLVTRVSVDDGVSPELLVAGGAEVAAVHQPRAHELVQKLAAKRGDGL